MSLNVLRARVSSIYPVCTSCVVIATTNGTHDSIPHSYRNISHALFSRCLGEHEAECPNCARNHGIIREIRRNNERLSSQHDVFLSEVKEGGFAAVAAGFSRGIMNRSRLDDVAA